MIRLLPTARYGGVVGVLPTLGSIDVTSTISLTITGSQFRNNTAVDSGGVIHVELYYTEQEMLQLTIAQSNFIHNMANGDGDYPGGGVVSVHMYGISQSAVVVNISAWRKCI